MMIQEEFSGSTDQLIVKGKRTKRRRPSPSTSSTSGVGEFHNSVFNFSSPSDSNYSTCTEEDEDMANCLILLARGGSLPQTEEEIKSPENKLIRKFTEMPSTTDGKIGIYGYECKTCNRTFSSFQALGGHRASHKRPKPAVDDRKISPPPLPPVKNEEGQYKIDSVIVSPIQSTQLRNKTLRLENKPKIHECSICGSEFGSGQALGGHMRRHRAVANASSNSRIGSGVVNDTLTEPKPRNMFALDLNLPASPEDDRQNGGECSSPPRHWWLASTRREEGFVDNI